MKFGSVRVKMRRFLRDPDARLWSDGILMAIWNQAQQELATEIGVLVEVRAMSVPPDGGYACMFAWEREMVSHAHQALRDHGGYCAYTHTDEILASAERDQTVNDVGVAYSQPWESWYLQSADPPHWALPDDWSQMVWAYYDREPLRSTTRDELQRSDRVWRTRTGTPQCWYLNDEAAAYLSLYPIPPADEWEDDDTESLPVTALGDGEETSEYGGVFYTDDYASSEIGVAIESIESEGNLLLFFEQAPRDIESETEELCWPDFAAKYVMYRALQRAYQVQNDGKNPDLAKFWEERFKIGVGAMKAHVISRRRARTYVWGGDGPVRRDRRGPLLPSDYPDPGP